MAVSQNNTITANDMTTTYYTKTEVNNLLATKKPNDNLNILFEATVTTPTTITLNDNTQNYKHLIIVGRNIATGLYRHYIITVQPYSNVHNVFLCDGNQYDYSYARINSISAMNIQITAMTNFALDLIIGVK